jgi:hypothetical protein
LCEIGHGGLVLAPIERCPHCSAPVRLTGNFVAVATDEAEAVRLAAVCDAVDGLADVLAEIARVVHNVCAVEGLTIADLSPHLEVSPRGVMIIELLSAYKPAA